MAQALNKTKRRIASVKSTKKITEAMELVATVKLKKYKNKMEANQFYVREIENIISHLFGVLNDEENPYLKLGKGEKNLVVVINSNLGLCASYNSNVFNFVANNLDKENDVLMTIGIKGELNYERAGFELVKEYSSLNEKLDYLEIVKLGRLLHSEFMSGKYKSVKLLYNRYINSLRFEPTLITLSHLKKETKL